VEGSTLLQRCFHSAQLASIQPRFAAGASGRIQRASAFVFPFAMPARYASTDGRLTPALPCRVQTAGRPACAVAQEPGSLDVVRAEPPCPSVRPLLRSVQLKT
jgi:hypothetical protein